MKVTSEEIKLKVVEALQDDVYKGVARIDPNLMRAMGLNRGDIISIKGQRETVAIVDRAYPADVGEGIIRVDGLIRRNAKTSVGEQVAVKKVLAKVAAKVAIAPAQQNIMVQGNPELFKHGLLGRVVLKGDIISLGGVQRRMDLMSEGFPDVFGDLNDLFGHNFGFAGFQQLRFMVTSTSPSQPCIINENTEVIVHSKAVDMSEENILEVTYEDIGGLNEEVRKVREMVELPLKHPEIFDRLGIEPPKGVLLHGPPGTGKTLLGKAVAKESEANFIHVKGPSLLSMWVGESEKGVRKVFERARQVAPCVIFFDEIDSMAGRRGVELGNKVTERVLNQLLAEIDGLEGLKDVTIIGATNRPDMLDPALLRPGRFDRVILVDVPDTIGRKDIFKVHIKQMPLDTDVNIDELVKQTEGYVGADIESLCREAAMNALRRDIEAKSVTKKDFELALNRVKPSVSIDTAKRYKKIEEYYIKQAKAGMEVGPIYAG